MKAENAIELIDKAIAPELLTDIQEQVFCLAWEGMGYSEIANLTNYDLEHIKRVGANLWQKLSNALGIKVSKSNMRGVFQRYARSYPIAALASPVQREQPINTNFLNLSEIINIPIYYGNAEELSTLRGWILGDRCQLVTILGMGGIGKTSLAVKMTLEIQENFEYVIWRSFRNAPEASEILSSLLQFLSPQPDKISGDSIPSQISKLMNYLRSFRCLLIFDNFGAIFKGGELAGTYQAGYEIYSEILHRIAEEKHQSCLVLTSREQPREVAPLEIDRTSVRSLYLSGLPINEAMAVLKSKGLTGSEAAHQRLVEIYRGNPLALKIVASCINELFAGQVEAFLEQATFVFIGIWTILDRQFNRLTELEKLVMYWLAIKREPIPLSELQKVITDSTKRKLLEALASLMRRSLIEKSALGFTQQPLVMEYISDHLTENAELLNPSLLLTA